ncbi:hypothetical protein WL29_21510 [Burkholderia ubonensis]|uniref:Uncharacterized protein n=1 Tax=Burkholderia ubonensis TaxID=101571 RepID=A0A106QCZ6_9BURK|nr:hypothetical protein [Burkholderia ubonensis]KWA83947.1 hypothetical protein WL29_21510 [Burkholderia ubonensis]
MTPEQKLKWAVLKIAASWAKKELASVTSDNVDQLYDALVADDGHWDARNEIRCTGIATGLSRRVPLSIARHYEHREVAAEMPDGTWVGWTFWHGGGKFDDSPNIEWMSEAYAVDHRAEPKTIMVDIFSLPEAAPAAQ